ncbi:MAG: hypothetical protein D6767_07600 [Candidatus Hydrogenedentota bacterium]|nr:MAG: hypothetical protein D6767_07600 [Candidatus Hydrogenedentota bacterium]
MKKHILLAVILAGIVSACRSIPEGVASEQAEKLAEEMRQKAGWGAWKKTQAVEFTFLGIRHHLWDKKRDYVMFRTDEGVTFFHRKTLKGRVFTFKQEPDSFLSAIPKDNLREVKDIKEKKEAIQKAYSAFINDFFWLQPAFHIFSPGAKRYLVEPRTLRVTFTSGGVTPGDTYVFTVRDDGLIQSMRMWVQIIPIKGIEARFVDYIETETGVKVAKKRESFLKDIEISDIHFYAEFPSTNQPDPFAGML